VGARALLVESCAAQREGGQIRDAREHALVALGEGPVAAPEREHAERAVVRDHGHSEPVRQIEALGHGVDVAPTALVDVGIGPYGPSPVEDRSREARRVARGVPERAVLTSAVLHAQDHFQTGGRLLGEQDHHVPRVEEARHLLRDGVEHLGVVASP